LTKWQKLKSICSQESVTLVQHPEIFAAKTSYFVWYSRTGSKAATAQLEPQRQSRAAAAMLSPPPSRQSRFGARGIIFDPIDRLARGARVAGDKMLRIVQ
jgi:hypothetical protein